MSVHNFNDLPAQVVPDLRDWMGEDFAQLLQTALSLRWGPLLLARAVE